LKKNLLLLFLTLILCYNTYSQIDQEFWFVAPDIDSGHGDNPIFMRISTMEDTSEIVLRMPANLGFTPITQKILPYTTYSINLTTWLNLIENTPPNQVLKRALLLTSNHSVTAYYECANESNPGIFSLKGKNALGTDFYIVSQNDYINQVGKEEFDIVATEDNTNVTITVTADITGHSAGETFTVTLMKGETYSARAVSSSANVSLAGSHITSNHPIAVTWMDDSIRTGGWDVVGDQTIPVNLLGKEYIAIKGYADNVPPNDDDERVFILATRDSTRISIDGAAVATLNTGEQYDYGIPAENKTAYIKTSGPCYVMHLSGHPGEAGASILPQDSCTGSSRVGFARTNDNVFALLILTRNGNQDSFYLNGDNTLITAADFAPVPGTGNNWVYFRQTNIPTSEVPVGGNMIENTKGTFHLGVLHMTGQSSEYGYFSNFASLYLGADANICPGDSMVMDGGAYMNSYVWKQVINGEWVTIDTNRFFTAHDTGYFACMTNGDFCTLMDTIHLAYYPNVTMSLGADRTICEKTTTTVDPGEFLSYLWSNGSPSRYLTTGIPGTYWVTVTNNNGCTTQDTIIIDLDSLPVITHAITGLDTVCQNQQNVSYSIDSLLHAESYIWTLPSGASGNSDTSLITLGFSTSAVSGPLKVRGHNGCGDSPDTTLNLTVKPLPGAAGPVSGASVVCQGDTGIVYIVPAVQHAITHVWSLPPGATIVSGAGNDTISVNFSLTASSGNITVFGQNDCGTGDTAVFPITVNLFPQPAGPVTGTSPVCQGQTGVQYSVDPLTGTDDYVWTVPSGASITSGAGTQVITVDFDSTALPGDITVRGHSNNCGDGITSSFLLTVNPLPEPIGAITGLLTVCQGQNNLVYSVNPVVNATSYRWTLPSGVVFSGDSTGSQVTLNFTTSAVSGVITVSGHNTLCGYGRMSSVGVTVNPLPAAAGAITGSSKVCQLQNGVTYSIPPIQYATSYTWTFTGAGSTLINNGSSATINFSATASSGNLTVTGNNGCGNGPVSPSYLITVNPIPAVTVQVCNPIVTRDAKPFTLRGGIPLGGTWSGDGVSGTLFNPSLVPLSKDTALVTYTYINTYGCSQQAVQKIKVFPVQSFTCGNTMTDVRDQKKYSTIKIGTQCWMAMNLNFGTGIRSGLLQRDNCIPEKYCYNDVAANCESEGGLYAWDEMMAYETTPGVQGLCPPGWHVPTENEWTILFNQYINGGFAASPLKYSGYSGFAALLQGVRVHNRDYIYKGFTTFLWTSNPLGQHKAWAHGMNDPDPSVSSYPAHRSNTFGVRCIRD